MTVVPDNCYGVDFPGSRRTTMCNIAKQLLIAYPVNGGSVQSVAKFDLKFSGKTEEGGFHCPRTVEAVHEHLQNSPHMSELSKMTNWPIDKIIPQVACIDYKMNWCCLDWYWPKKDSVWVENPCCKIPQFGTG